ncbi:MAG: tRNA (adenosine(37)-N6)-threonylcarbamoyltransferase complex dimerization subunit type 1 TsaB [Clostridia bacterium]|nr:tRNA (adenosine(37)-N6)-threonylcarbamoyltransferase complex dimerization subunit type 1 TsaB [Clostridia bacterium]
MITLGLDTTAKTVTAALLSDGEPLSFFSSEAKTTHSASLLPAIRALLAAASLGPEDVGLFAVSAGPGSFTGVRIGVATVKGLAFGREVPCVGVSSLAALAENASREEGAVLAAMDARRGQLYCARFTAKDGILLRETPDAALAAADAAAGAKAAGLSSVTVVGDGASLAAGALEKEGIACRFLHPLLARQNAYSVALCGYRSFLAGRYTTAEQLLPVYLRGFTGGPNEEKN